VRLLYLILVLWMDRTSVGLRSHRTFTSLHSDGGPYSLPATVWSRSDCDYTKVSLSDAQGHGQPICQDWPAAWVCLALFLNEGHGVPAAWLVLSAHAPKVSGSPIWSCQRSILWEDKSPSHKPWHLQTFFEPYFWNFLSSFSSVCKPWLMDLQTAFTLTPSARAIFRLIHVEKIVRVRSVWPGCLAICWWHNEALDSSSSAHRSHRVTWRQKLLHARSRHPDPVNNVPCSNRLFSGNSALCIWILRKSRRPHHRPLQNSHSHKNGYTSRRLIFFISFSFSLLAC